jgi:hypothetical protein
MTRRSHRLRSAMARGLLLVAALALLGCLPTAASADETVLVCDIYGNHVAPAPSWTYGIRTSSRCPGNGAEHDNGHRRPPGGMSIWTVSHKQVRHGRRVQWLVRAPEGLLIRSVYVPHMYTQGIDDGGGWGGGFSWAGGSRGVGVLDRENTWSSTAQAGPRFNWPSHGSRYFAWRVVCRASRCRNGGSQWLSVEFLEIHVRETRRPHLGLGAGLWHAKGWIRGSWKLDFSGDSPTGLCGLSATLRGRSGPGSFSTQNRAIWHQCDARSVHQVIDTARYGQGPMPLTIRALDAAGVSVSRTKTVKVDNVQPTVALSGPDDASSAAGTQYIKASAAAGPSGVAGISCSLDLAPARFYPSAVVEIPVRGVGVHHLSCESESNARDEAGRPATSHPATWTLTVLRPSASTLSFVRVGHALHCVRRREWVWVPGHWTIAYRHGHKVRRKVPRHRRRVEVVHCHPRVVHRRVRQDGHWTTQREVVLPHRVAVNKAEVPFGSRPIVWGWLGTTNGNALGGQPVRIFTAPDNGAGKFTQAAFVRTAPDGVWNARLPAGPSRVVVAWYGGGRMVEPSLSQPVHLAVKASLSFQVRPRVTHWGDTVRLSGRVHGGYVPPSGEIVVLWVGWKGGSTEIGHVYTRRDGRFATSYTFLRGHGTERYQFWATSLHEADYPYAPGSSNRVRVKVGP